MRLAASRTFWTAGSSSPMRMAMMAITTSNSISVKPDRRRNMVTPHNGLTKSHDTETNHKTTRRMDGPLAVTAATAWAVTDPCRSVTGVSSAGRKENGQQQRQGPSHDGWKRPSEQPHHQAIPRQVPILLEGKRLPSETT